MQKPNAVQLEVARRLLDERHQGPLPVSDTGAAVERVYAGLLQTLSPILGSAGAPALFTRSIKLAESEFPALSTVDLPVGLSVGPSEVARALVGRLRELEPNAREETAVGMLAVLLNLLTNFIGEPLVWQMVQRAFPENVRAHETSL